METPKSKTKTNRSRLRSNVTEDPTVPVSILTGCHMLGSSSSVPSAPYTGIDSTIIAPYTGIDSCEVVWSPPCDRSKKNSSFDSSKAENRVSDSDSPSHYYVPPKRRLIRQQEGLDYSDFILAMSKVNQETIHGVCNSTSSSYSQRGVLNAEEVTESDAQEATRTDEQELQNTCKQLLITRLPAESLNDSTSFDLAARQSSCKRSLAGNSKTETKNTSLFVDLTFPSSDGDVPINAPPPSVLPGDMEQVDDLHATNLTSYFEDTDDLMTEHLLRVSQELEKISASSNPGNCKVPDNKSLRPPEDRTLSTRGKEKSGEPLAVFNQSNVASYKNTRIDSQVNNKTSRDKVRADNERSVNIIEIPNSFIQARDSQPKYYIGKFRKPLTASEIGRNINKHIINQKSYVADTSSTKRQEDKVKRGSSMSITATDGTFDVLYTAKFKGQCAQTTRKLGTESHGVNSSICSNVPSNTKIKASKPLPSSTNSKAQFTFVPQKMETSHSLASHVVTSKSSSSNVKAATVNSSSFTIKTASNLGSKLAVKGLAWQNGTALNSNKSSVDCGNSFTRNVKTVAPRTAGTSMVPVRSGNTSTISGNAYTNINHAGCNSTGNLSGAVESKNVILSQEFEFSADIDDDVLNNVMDENMELLSQGHSNPVIMGILDSGYDSGLKGSAVENPPNVSKKVLSNTTSTGLNGKIGNKSDAFVIPNSGGNCSLQHLGTGHIQATNNSSTITSKPPNSVANGSTTHVSHLAVKDDGSHEVSSGVGTMSSEDHDAMFEGNFYDSEQFFEMLDSLESATSTPSEGQEIEQRRLEAWRKSNAKKVLVHHRVASTRSGYIS